MDIYLDIMRVLHIGAAIIWIGLLYYFNFVQVPAVAKMDASARSQIVQHLAPIALAWFRYAALGTVLFGVAYIIGIGIDLDRYFNTPRFYSIAIGGTMGIIMAVNVWVIIWPNQKKIIAATTATAQGGAPVPPEQPKWARRAFLASRVNTMLSIPLLFFMVAAVHLQKLWN